MGRSWKGVAAKGRGADGGDDLSASLSELPTYYLTFGVREFFNMRYITFLLMKIS